MRRTSKAFALSSMLGSLAFGSSALAQDGSEVDLTGTWQGAQICEGLIGGEFVHFVIVDNPLLVVQDGDRFRFLYIGEPEEEIADDLVYEGVIQTVEGSDHFEALAGICGGDYKAEEIVRLAADRNLGNRGPLRCRILSSSPMTFRRSRGFSTSRPASGRTRGCRRSRPTCRSASDQAFARRDDEGDGQAHFPG